MCTWPLDSTFKVHVYGLHHTCSAYVSAHYFRERGKRLFVGVAGVALRPGEALQSGKT